MSAICDAAQNATQEALCWECIDDAPWGVGLEFVVILYCFAGLAVGARQRPGLALIHADRMR